MLAYTIGIPLSIFAFLLVGALVGTSAPDPGAGIMPGFIAGCAVLVLCRFLQNKENNALEHPEVITADCSPEKAFSTVYECLMASHNGPHYWNVQTLQNSMRIVGTMRFDELVSAVERPVAMERFIRLLVKVGTNAAGKTTVTLHYTVHSPQGRWKVDEGIAKTTSWIKRDLMSA